MTIEFTSKTKNIYKDLSKAKVILVDNKTAFITNKHLMWK